MADDRVAHLEIEGVEGESDEKGFKNQIKITHWEIAASAGSSVSQTGGSGGPGKGQPHPLHFIAPLDASGGPIVQKLYKGEHFPKAKLTAHRVGDGHKIVEIDFKQVYVAHASVSQSPGTMPVMDVTLTYNSISYQYSKQKEQGIEGKTGKISYDSSQNEVS